MTARPGCAEDLAAACGTSRRWSRGPATCWAARCAGPRPSRGAGTGFRALGLGPAPPAIRPVAASRAAPGGWPAHRCVRPTTSGTPATGHAGEWSRRRLSIRRGIGGSVGGREDRGRLHRRPGRTWPCTGLLRAPPRFARRGLLPENEVMWRVADAAWLYVVVDPARRRPRSLAALSVGDLDAHPRRAGRRGITPSSVEPVRDAARKATVLDPDGNSVRSSRWRNPRGRSPRSLFPHRDVASAVAREGGRPVAPPLAQHHAGRRAMRSSSAGQRSGTARPHSASVPLPVVMRDRPLRRHVVLLEAEVRGLRREGPHGGSGREAAQLGHHDLDHEVTSRLEVPRRRSGSTRPARPAS